MTQVADIAQQQPTGDAELDFKRIMAELGMFQWHVDNLDTPPGREMSDLRNKVAGLLEVVKMLAGDKWPELVVKLAADANFLRFAAGKEKQRGDMLAKRVDGLEIQLRGMQILTGGEAGDTPEIAQRRQVNRIVGVFGKWIAFVQSKKEYMRGAGWGAEGPSQAAVVHSSLLQRMLMGQEPMSDDDYKKWKAGGK
jgi:hypothetical protein